VIALREAECCALAGTDCRPLLLRRRAGRPQLKRDPLGAHARMHIMFLLPLLGLAVQGPPQDSVTQVILRLEAQRRASHLTGDATQLAAILADDFIDIGANGLHRTKQQNVEDTRSHVIRWTTLVVSNEQVQVFDSTAAVVTGEQQGAGTYRGQPFARRTRYLRVYLKRRGRWQNVAAQSALITP